MNESTLCVCTHTALSTLLSLSEWDRPRPPRRRRDGGVFTTSGWIKLGWSITQQSFFPDIQCVAEKFGKLDTLIRQMNRRGWRSGGETLTFNVSIVTPPTPRSSGASRAGALGGTRRLVGESRKQKVNKNRGYEDWNFKMGRNPYFGIIPSDLAQVNGRYWRHGYRGCQIRSMDIPMWKMR